MTSVNGVVSIPPSERWEGGIGRWSTFQIQIGTPRQAVRLLPGTSATAADTIWTVISEGCDQAFPRLTDCATKRGNLFQRANSTTWSTQRLSNGGLYELGMYEEAKLGLTDNNAYYGFDTVQLGSQSSAINLTGQLIAGIATPNFFLGSLGLSPIPFNFTDYNTPVPSLLGSLRNQSLVESTSWAYTAGKPYRNPPVYGSLTFGGYDAERGSDRTLEIPFNQDISRDLVVGLQSITYDSLGSSPLLAQGIFTFLNSLVPDMWLPLTVCQQFEKIFNITWSESQQLYYVNDAAHASLMAQNPAFTFTIGALTSGGNTTQITFPYSAFDLNATTPDISQSLNTSRYFPLKRAANSTQYTLGRVFFQEAYVIADYDTQSFSVQQAQNNANASDFRSLAPVRVTLPTESSGIGTGAIVGMVVAFIVLVFGIGMAIWILLRRRRTKRRRAEEAKAVEVEAEDRKEMPAEDVSKSAKFELDQQDSGIHELKTEEAELGNGLGHELPVVETPAELTSGLDRHELPGFRRPAEMGAGVERQEMPANEKGVEPDARWYGRYELPG